ncbi:fibronectin/fibrinogen-binding protein [Candidatus Micrarchaeota archaeon]|nr:fibronectin/fibrinogen-binding protein [Candidatus Micrarchaeota archaeon]
MSAIDYSFAVKELSSLSGAFFVKPYLVDAGVYRLKFNSKTMGNVNVLIELPNRLNFTKYVDESNESDGLVKFLRESLENARVKSIKQLNEDRVVCFCFEKKEEFNLVFELFGKGNALLCDSEMKILRVITKAEYSARTLKRGEVYALPPQEKQSPFTVKEIPAPEKEGKIVSWLAKNVNLSPFYLEEAVTRAGYSLDATTTEADFSKIAREIKKMVSEAKPFVYYNEGKPVAFSFCELKKLSFEKKEFSSFSEALDEYYFNAEKTISKTRGVEKTLGQINQQKTLLQEFESQADELNQAGNWVYENSEFVEKLFKEITSRQAKGLKNKEIEEELNQLLQKKGLSLKFKDYKTIILEK